MHLLDCFFLMALSLLGQLLSILIQVRKHLAQKSFDWTYWRRRNLPEYIISLVMSALVIVPLCISEFRFLETLGIYGEWGHPLASFLIGFSLDYIVNRFSKFAIRK